MSGYFSRLIQQTGIALGTGKVSDGGKFQDAIAPQLGHEIVPIQIEENQEEIEQTETPENELKPTRRVEDENIVDSQLLNRPTVENTNHIPLPTVQRESSLPILEAQNPKNQEEQVESFSVQITSSQNAIAPEFFPELPKFDNREDSDRTLENRRNHAVLETAGAVPLFPKKWPELALSKHLQQRDFPEGLPSANRSLPDRQTIEILKEPNLPPTRQVNLQTVLEWVAETPAENPNSQLPIPNYQLPIPNFQTQKNQNFVLSIGTISLTVEAPQSEVKKPPLPPIKSQQEVKSVSQNSRLSRHYIR